MPGRMLALQIRSAVGLCLVTGCSTSSTEKGTLSTASAQAVEQGNSANPAAIGESPLLPASESAPDHVPGAEYDAIAVSMDVERTSSPRAASVEPSSHAQIKIETQGNLKMENPKANTTALQLQPLSVPGSQDGHAFDLAQMGIGAAGLALLYGGYVLVRRASIEQRRKRAEAAQQAEERLLHVVRDAVSAELEMHKKADVTAQPEAAPPALSATPAADSAAEQPTQVAAQNAHQPLKPEPKTAPIQEEQPTIPVVTEVIAPPADRRKSDPKYIAARRLLDALHKAERDVEPFLDMINRAQAPDAQDKHASANRVIISWHQCIQRTRNSLQEAFARHQLLDELPSTSAPDNLSDALTRLYQHAAFFTSLLTVQQKPKSPILTLSKQLPGAVLQLYWHAQTHVLAKDMQANPMPMLPEIPSSSRSPAAPPDNGDYQFFLNKAMGGVHVAK